MSAQLEQVDTATQVLDIAERLVQTRGFNAFSYGDVASELGVSSAALHYHFRNKATLGDALIARYSERFFRALTDIHAEEKSARVQLERYVDLYRSVLLAGRMCLCGILAAEYQTLPGDMRAAVLTFFDRNEEWLGVVLSQGARDREFANAEPIRDTARVIIDTLEGAVMVARAQDEADRFDRVSARMLASITG